MRPFRDNKIVPHRKLLPRDRFKPYIDLPGDPFTADVKAGLIARAREALAIETPMITATDFLKFAREGDRAYYEGKFFARRAKLLALLMGEAAQREGAFTDGILDLTWMILEESTWVLPAHAYVVEGLPYDYDRCDYLDLFAATTAATLAWVHYYGDKTLGTFAPLVKQRIAHELYRRVLEPMMQYDMESWMGFSLPEHLTRMNNWGPWIVSNLLFTVAVCVEDMPRREAMTQRLMTCLDNYMEGYDPDGGCDEGPGYWTAAGASVLDALEILYDMSGGELDIFHLPLIRKMGEYIVTAFISGDSFVTYSDAHPHLQPEYQMIARFGRRTASPALQAFGGYGLARTKKSFDLAKGFHVYRALKDILDTYTPAGDATFPTATYLEDMGILFTRESGDPDKGLYLSAKSGYNLESHNHNDVGSFLVYGNGKPLLIDAGVGTYTRDTFDRVKRYTIWTMRSPWHSIPSFNGVEQRYGQQYRSRNVHFDGEANSLSLDMTLAYPPESGLESYRRTTALKEGRITLREEIALKEAGEIEFHFLLADEPALVGEGAALPEGYRLTWPEGLTAKLEAIPLTDDSLREDWRRENLYRLSLTASDTPGGEYLFQIQ